MIPIDSFAERGVRRESEASHCLVIARPRHETAVLLERNPSSHVDSGKRFKRRSAMSNQMPNQNRSDEKRQDQNQKSSEQQRKSEIRKAVEQDEIDPKNPKGQQDTGFSGGP
jgi:hypothetical protein